MVTVNLKMTFRRLYVWKLYLYSWSIAGYTVEYCEELWFPQYLESILDEWDMQNTVLTVRYLVQTRALGSIVVSSICGEHFGRVQGAEHCGSRQEGGQWRWGARDICINIPLYTDSLIYVVLILAQIHQVQIPKYTNMSLHNNRYLH